MLCPSSVIKLMLVDDVGPISRTRSDSSPRIRCSIWSHPLECRETRPFSVAAPPALSLPPKKLVIPPLPSRSDQVQDRSVRRGILGAGQARRDLRRRGLQQLNLALHARIFFNRQPPGDDVSLHHRRLTQINPPRHAE